MADIFDRLAMQQQQQQQQEPDIFDRLAGGFEMDRQGAIGPAPKPEEQAPDRSIVGPNFSPRAAAEKMLTQIQVRSHGEVEPGAGTLLERVEGAAIRGVGNLGRGMAYAPLHVMDRIRNLSKTKYTGPSYAPVGRTPPKSGPTKQAIGAVQDWYKDFLSGQDKQIEEIYERHPEWATIPPKNFQDLITHPDKLAAAVVESTPLLVAAGLASAGGMPGIGYTLLFTSEGQQAYDQAIADGQTEKTAGDAYVMYGSVAAVLENLQLKGFMRVGKKSYQSVLKRAVGKIGTLKRLTPRIIKESLREAVEEMAQGTWQEATAYLLYGKKPVGGLRGFIDRRAQEGLIAATMTGAAGAAGGGAGGIVGQATNEKEAATLNRAQEIADEIEKSPNMPDDQKKAMLHTLQQTTEQAIGVEKEAGLYEGIVEAAARAGDTTPATSFIPGTQIEYDETKDIFNGKDNLVLFKLNGKEVHSIKLRNAAAAKKMAEDYRDRLSTTPTAQIITEVTKKRVLRKVYSKGFVAKLTSIRNNADNIVAGAGSKESQVKVMKSDLAKIQEHYDNISEDIRDNPELLAELGKIEELLPEYADAINSFTESPSKEGFERIKAVGDQIAEFSNEYGRQAAKTGGVITLKESAKESVEVARIKPSGDVITPTVEPVVQTNLAQLAKVAPIRLTSDSKDTSALLDMFYAERDDKETATKVVATQHQAELTEIMGLKKYGQDAKLMDFAVHVYIDLQNNPDQIKHYDKLTAAQKKVVDLAQNLPPEVQSFADKIIAENKAFGDIAKDQEVIHNSKEYYTAILWGQKEKRPLFKKFGTTTARAKARTLEGILHGWSLGKTLRITGAIEAQKVAHMQVTQAMVDKQVMKLAKDWGLISPKRLEGWVRVEHPNFTTWKFAGKAEPGEAYGQNFFVTKEGTVMERVEMYAEPVLAKKLNNALTGSKLRGIAGIDWLSKWNAIIKQNILMTSFFHHQAYLRSYMAGGRTGFKNLSPVKGYKKGRKAILNYEPEFQQLVRGGLLTGEIQEWNEEDLWQKDTVYSRVARHFEAGEKGLDAVNEIMQQQKDFLFKKLGPYLKVQTALLEYRFQLKKNRGKLERGEITQHDIAKMVADYANDDFGNLNLRRMGRNPTVQHIFQLVTLAPDWTESNIRSMVKAFKGGDEGAIYRALWGRVAFKMGVATIIFNLLMAAGDDKDFIERYQKAWKAGSLRWLDVDITPLYRLLGGSHDKRKYFSLIGHFKDPVKFAIHPVRSAKHKGSVTSRIFLDVITGEDWRSRKFTSFSEILGIDDKGKYKTASRKGGYRRGEEKGGKLRGALTKYSAGGGKPVEYSQALSFILYEARAAQPIQVQNNRRNRRV